MKRFASILSLLALTLILTLVGGGCVQPHDAVYLAVLGPETGDYAEFGVEACQGASMVVSAFSKGKFTSERLPFELINYDTRGDLTLMEEQFRRLVEVDGVAAIIVSDPRPEAVRLAARLAAEYKVAVLLVADTLGTSRESPSANLYNLRTPYDLVIPEAVGVAVDRAALRKLALISDELPLYREYLPLLRRELESRPAIEYHELELSLTGYDYDSAAYRLLAESYDGLIFNGGRRSLQLLMSACARITYHPRFVALAEARPLRLSLPENQHLGNGYFVGGFSAFSTEARTTAFVDTFRASVGYMPSPTAAAAYDAARLVLRAINRADSAAAGPVGGALAALGTHEGVAGAYVLDATPETVYVERTRPASTGIVIELADFPPAWIPPTDVAGPQVENPLGGFLHDDGDGDADED